MNNMCIFWLVNLIKMTYLIIYQIEHLIKLKQFDQLNQNGYMGFNQVKQRKMACLVKMTNGFFMKLDILC
jgi:hypothetical protein